MQFISRLILTIYYISWDIQVEKSSYQGFDGLMKRSMEAKHLIEDTTSVFFCGLAKPQVGRFPLGLMFFCWFLFVTVCFLLLLFLFVTFFFVVVVVATRVVGGISVRKIVWMFCSPMVKGCMSYFKHHDLMMVILRKKGRTITKWNLENTSTYKIQYLFDSIHSTTWMNLKS